LLKCDNFPAVEKQPTIELPHFEESRKGYLGRENPNDWRARKRFHWTSLKPFGKGGEPEIRRGRVKSKGTKRKLQKKSQFPRIKGRAQKQKENEAGPSGLERWGGYGGVGGSTGSKELTQTKRAARRFQESPWPPGCYASAGIYNDVEEVE